MTTMTSSLEELSQAVVAAALADTTTLEVVMSKYAARVEGQTGSLLQAAGRYFTLTRGIMDREALSDILAKNIADPIKHQEYLALFDALTEPPYSDKTEAQHRWALHQFHEQWQIEETGKALAAASDALVAGHDSHGEHQTGAAAAWAVLSEARMTFDALANPDALSESEITASFEQAMREYDAAVLGGHSGLPCKLPELAAPLGGWKPAALHIYAAYATQGKSQFLVNDAHDLLLKGKNVCFASGEMTEQEVRNRVYSVHSTLSQFERPVPVEGIDRGNLTPEELAVFKEVLADLAENPAYGKLFVFQFPFMTTPTTLFNKIKMYDQIVPLDALCLDYLQLLTCDRPRMSRREELDDMCRQVRAMGLSFDKGRSIPVLTAWQVNRESYKRALEIGYYDLTCLSECAQAEQSATSVMWLLQINSNPDQVKAGFIKNRGGQLGEEFYLSKRFQYSQLSSLKTGSGGSVGTKGAPAAPAKGILDL